MVCVDRGALLSTARDGPYVDGMFAPVPYTGDGLSNRGKGGNGSNNEVELANHGEDDSALKN